MTKTIHSIESLSVRELLVEYRIASNLSQRAIVKKLKWTQSKIAKIESGERRIDLIEFLAIAKVLQIDLQKFVEELEIRIKKNKKLYPDKPTID